MEGEEALPHPESSPEPRLTPRRLETLGAWRPGTWRCLQVATTLQRSARLRRRRMGSQPLASSTWGAGLHKIFFVR